MLSACSTRTPPSACALTRPLKNVDLRARGPPARTQEQGTATKGPGRGQGSSMLPTSAGAEGGEGAPPVGGKEVIMKRLLVSFSLLALLAGSIIAPAGAAARAP